MSAHARGSGAKAARYGRVFQRVGRMVPSSQRCSNPDCHRIDGPKPLSVRTRTCQGCGTVHDRDTDAADNTLQEGRRLYTLKVAEGHRGDPKRLRKQEASESPTHHRAAKRHSTR